MSVAAKESRITIREAQPRDYARMAELSGQLGYNSTGEVIARRLSEMLESGEHAVFVAETAEGEIAGWVGVYVFRCVEADARSEISGFVVDERMRSAGIGRLLLDRAEEWGRQKNCAEAGVRCNVIRERAHAFYVRHGYKVTKTQKSFRKTL
jgi:GNAT superfamily N-acetyltransferase